jgi:hypothetical protein
MRLCESLVRQILFFLMGWDEIAISFAMLNIGKRRCKRCGNECGTINIWKFCVYYRAVLFFVVLFGVKGLYRF